MRWNVELSSPLHQTVMMVDFFISYTKGDRTWAEWIAWHLEAEGYSTLIQAWDIRPGSNFALAMQRATVEAERTIAVLSSAYLSSRFTQPEWAAAFAQDPTGEHGLLVPVRVGECDLQGLLPQIVYIDLIGLDEDDAKTALLSGVQLGRAKPSAAPSFPGPIISVSNTIFEKPSFPGLSEWEFPDLHSNRNWLAEAVQIERSEHYRRDIAERLHSEPLGQRYLRMLHVILALAERIWGPRGSSQAFITCFFLSMIYAYILFWLSLTSKSVNPFRDTEGLEIISQLSSVLRWSLFGLAVLYPIAAWLLGIWLGFIEKRFKTSQRRRRSPQARRRWSRLYRLAPGVVLIGWPVVTWWLSEDELPRIIGGGIYTIGQGLLLAAGPILGIAWGGRARTPWRTLFFSMGVGAIAGAVMSSEIVVGTVVFFVAVVFFAATLPGTIAGAIVVAGAIAGAGAAADAIAVALPLDFTGADPSATIEALFAGIDALVFVFAVAFTGAVAGAVAVMSVYPGVKQYNLYAAIIGGLTILAFVKFLPGSDQIPFNFVYFDISMLILPVMNGGLDYASWWVSRFLGHDLTHGLSSDANIVTTLTRSLAHIAADLILALFFFVAMAFALGLAFESYDLYANLQAVDMLSKADQTGYAETLRDDPLGAGLWVTLMLITTLIPTVIHFGMVVGAILPATLLPDHHRQALAEKLMALGETPPPVKTTDRETWAATIRESAKFAAGYRWRMLWGVVLSCGLIAVIFYGLGQLYPHVFLTEWAYWGGVKGIETARWLFGAVRGTPGL